MVINTIVSFWFDKKNNIEEIQKKVIEISKKYDINSNCCSLSLTSIAEDRTAELAQLHITYVKDETNKRFSKFMEEVADYLDSLKNIEQLKIYNLLSQGFAIASHDLLGKANIQSANTYIHLVNEEKKNDITH